MPTSVPYQSSLSRRALLAGSAGVLAAGLGGCAGNGGKTLRATWWGDPNLNAAVRKAITAFERSANGTKVNSEFLPAGNSEPDLIMHAGTYLPEYVPRHVLLDLDPYIGDSIGISGIDRSVRDAGEYDGGTYAVIAAINSPTVMYNRRLLQKSGLEPPDHTWTWSDLESMCARVRRSLGDGVYGVQDAGVT